jgi:hypothetical protein
LSGLADMEYGPDERSYLRQFSGALAASGKLENNVNFVCNIEGLLPSSRRRNKFKAQHYWKGQQ